MRPLNKEGKLIERRITPPRENNQVDNGRAQNSGISENEISDAETIIIDSESETEQISE